MQAIAKQTGKVPSELAKVVDVPAAGLLILDYYARIDQGRSYTSEGSPMPLSHQDIYAWCQLTNTSLTDFELNAIKQLDITSINNIYKQRRSRG